eukprot:scaffold25830_cov162-Cylindrotheca_fusiformis.AAC.7
MTSRSIDCKHVDCGVPPPYSERRLPMKKRKIVFDTIVPPAVSVADHQSLPRKRCRKDVNPSIDTVAVSNKTRTGPTLLHNMVHDLLHHLGMIVSREARKQLLIERKMFWRDELGLSKIDFSKVWIVVKNKYIVQRQNVRATTTLENKGRSSSQLQHRGWLENNNVNMRLSVPRLEKKPALEKIGTEKYATASKLQKKDGLKQVNIKESATSFQRKAKELSQVDVTECLLKRSSNDLTAKEASPVQQWSNLFQTGTASVEPYRFGEWDTLKRSP